MGGAGLRELRASAGRLAEDWRALSRCPSFYLTYDWMTAMASTVGAELHALVLSGDAREPLIGVPFAVMTQEGGAAAFDPLRVLAEAATQCDVAGRALDCHPVVTSVAPGFMGGVCESPLLDAGDADAATDALLRELEGEARSRGAGAVAFLYVPEAPGSRLERLARTRGYRSVVVAGRCVLPVAWPTFEDYLCSRTKTRRKSIRAEVDRFRAVLEIELAGGEAMNDDLVPLHAAWRAKYGRPVPEPELRRQYAAVRERLAPAVRVFVARRGGRPAAFAQFYEHDGTWYSRAIGFDYGLVDGSFAYFNVLFYEPLREAMARGIGALDYSFGSYEAKLGRGCTLQHFLLLLKPLVPVEPGFDEYLCLVDRERRAAFARLREQHP